jgi:hypothetical protein
MKIFWSWQSDTHQPTGRHFVRGVLADLARELNGLDGTEDSERPEDEVAYDEALEAGLLADDGRIEVDHDTLGVGGSPEIAPTILKKICEAAVFVADVTPIAKTLAGKRVPNPNVMIELGYALRVLEHERIVLVMNHYDGGELKHLPFDLRHWRAPAIYKLKRDATDEHMAEVAADLKAALKLKIVPGIRLAERVRRDEARLKNRAPELVVTEALSQTGRSLAQTITRLGVKSLEEIQAETPLLIVPKAPSPLLASSVANIGRISARSALGSSFGRSRPVEEWSRAEIENHNVFVERYYRQYGQFLDERAEWVRLLLRSFELELKLENRGTAPGTDIDVNVYFPDTVTLFEAKKFAPEPTPPEPPPLKPLAPGMARIVETPFKMDFPTPFIPRDTHVFPEERRVHFSVGDLKHHHTVSFDAVILAFNGADDIGPFTAEYMVTANEPIDPIRGEIEFAVSWTANSSDS